MLKTKEEIKRWLDGMGVTNYTINDDLTVDVDDDVDLRFKNLTEIPVQFNEVKYYFSCAYNQLTSLEGSPRKVGDHFYCHNNQLTSLEDSPRKVGDYFYCHNNQLTSLEGSPEEVGCWFYSDIQNFKPDEYKEFVKLRKRKEKLNSLDLG